MQFMIKKGESKLKITYVLRIAKMKIAILLQIRKLVPATKGARSLIHSFQ